MHGTETTSYREIYLKCPHPGLKGNLITIRANSYHTFLYEVEVLDCPNGFFHLNNRCVKWMADDTLVNLHKKCDLHRGRLLDTSSHLTENVLLAMKVMTDKSADKIFAGKLRMEKKETKFLKIH